MPRDHIVSTRLADEDVVKLDAIVEHLKKTKPEGRWNRATVLRHLIEKFHEAMGARR